jgi:hypothetical protein
MFSPTVENQIVRRHCQIICHIFIAVKSPVLSAFLTEFYETPGQGSLESVKPRRMGCHIREMRGSNLDQGADFMTEIAVVFPSPSG